MNLQKKYEMIGGLTPEELKEGRARFALSKSGPVPPVYPVPTVPL